MAKANVYLMKFLKVAVVENDKEYVRKEPYVYSYFIGSILNMVAWLGFNGTELAQAIRFTYYVQKLNGILLK